MGSKQLEALQQAQLGLSNAMAALHDAERMGVPVAATLGLCRDAQERLRALALAEREGA